MSAVFHCEDGLFLSSIASSSVSACFACVRVAATRGLVCCTRALCLLLEGLANRMILISMQTKQLNEKLFFFSASLAIPPVFLIFLHFARFTVLLVLCEMITTFFALAKLASHVEHV